MASDLPEQQQVSGSGFGVGVTLKAARERMGKSVSECAEQLRIRRPYLEALEDGRTKDLPGGTYAIGFLRTYAEFLSLDGEEMARRYRSEGAGDFQSRSELVFPSPVSEGRIPGGAVIFLGILLASVSYGGWYWLSSRDTKVAEVVPAIPDRLSTVLSRQATLTGEAPKPAMPISPPADPAPAQPLAAAAPVEPVSVAPAPRPAAEPPKVRDEVVPPAEAEEEKIAVIAPADKASPEPARPAAEEARTPDGDGRVVLKAAADDCWVQVRELDGSLLLSRLLRRGDSYRVPNRGGLVLMVGNAGALEVSVDGRKAPSLGASGQVKRDIRLDPEKLMVGG